MSKKIIRDNGSIEYVDANDRLHREDGPAIEYPNGYKEWRLNGALHREGGPAIEYANGNKHWYKHGKLHRDDGPAIEIINGLNGYWHSTYFVHNAKHNENGPAEKDSNGNEKYYLFNIELSKEDWEKSKIHHLKTWPEYYQEVANYTKRFEIRFDDRNFQTGDFLVLEEWDRETQMYTGRKLACRILYILKDELFTFNEDSAILSISEPVILEGNKKL